MLLYSFWHALEVEGPKHAVQYEAKHASCFVCDDSYANCDQIDAFATNGVRRWKGLHQKTCMVHGRTFNETKHNVKKEKFCHLWVCPNKTPLDTERPWCSFCLNSCCTDCNKLLELLQGSFLEISRKWSLFCWSSQCFRLARQTLQKGTAKRNIWVFL